MANRPGVPANDEATPFWLRPPRPPRKPRPNLNREEITRAAIELADGAGLEAVSMRNIAAKLGAGATSLYWYVGSKEDLYELMADELIGEIKLPKHPSRDWRADLRAIAFATRQTLSKHSWFTMLGIQPGFGPKTRRYAQRASAALIAQGIEREEWINILGALNNYINGFVYRESAWNRLRRQSGLDERQWTARVEGIVQRTADQDQEAAAQTADRLRLHSDYGFEFGLNIVLDGIAARLESLATDALHPRRGSRRVRQEISKRSVNQS
jgi:AcrR family transcriptional regulator